MADAATRGSIAAHRFFVSAVTLAEVLAGAHPRHHDEEVVPGFFDDLVSEILPVGTATAERAARPRAAHKALACPTR